LKYNKEIQENSSVIGIRKRKLKSKELPPVCVVGVRMITVLYEKKEEDDAQPIRAERILKKLEDQLTDSF